MAVRLSRSCDGRVTVPRSRSRELRRAGLPRLLIVGPDDDPVIVPIDVEDWLRLPVDDRDVRMRLLRLRDRADPAAEPVRCWTATAGCCSPAAGSGLSAVEERLARAAGGPLRPSGQLPRAPRGGLAGPGQGEDHPPAAHHGLRRRVSTIGLELRSIRDVGHLLEAS